MNRPPQFLGDSLLVNYIQMNLREAQLLSLEKDKVNDKKQEVKSPEIGRVIKSKKSK